MSLFYSFSLRYYLSLSSFHLLFTLSHFYSRAFTFRVIFFTLILLHRFFHVILVHLFFPPRAKLSYRYSTSLLSSLSIRYTYIFLQLYAFSFFLHFSPFSLLLSFPPDQFLSHISLQPIIFSTSHIIIRFPSFFSSVSPDIHRLLCYSSPTLSLVPFSYSPHSHASPPTFFTLPHASSFLFSRFSLHLFRPVSCPLAHSRQIISFSLAP